jgi:hypothetical protein
MEFTGKTGLGRFDVLWQAKVTLGGYGCGSRRKKCNSPAGRRSCDRNWQFPASSSFRKKFAHWTGRRPPQHQKKSSKGGDFRVYYLSAGGSRRKSWLTG